MTVVYGRDLPGLALQARSIARFFEAELGGIFVVVNDVDSEACAAAVEGLRSEYGRHADKLEVVMPESLFALRPRDCRPRGWARFAHWYTAHRSVYPFGQKGGWRGNRGWSLQQALKLAAARRGAAPYVLILDGKNHFVRPVATEAFVAPDMRPLSQLACANDEHWSWIVASFARLGVGLPPREAAVPQSITPFVASRAVLREAVEALERRLGPMETFFARKNTLETEFMLIYAQVVRRWGSWEEWFAPGLVPPATIFGRSTDADVAAVLDRAERGEADVLSVHSGRAASLAPEHRARLRALWAAAGLA